MPGNKNKVVDDDRMNAALAIASLSVPGGKSPVNLAVGGSTETPPRPKVQTISFKPGHVQSQMMPSRQKNLVQRNSEMISLNLSNAESNQGIDLSSGSLEKKVTDPGRFVRTSAWFGQSASINLNVVGQSQNGGLPSLTNNQALQFLSTPKNKTVSISSGLLGTPMSTANLLKINSVPNFAVDNSKGLTINGPIVSSGLPPVSGRFFPQNNDEVYLQNIITQSPVAAPVFFVGMPTADGGMQCIPINLSNLSLVNSLALLSNQSQAGLSRVPSSVPNIVPSSVNAINLSGNEISAKTVDTVNRETRGKDLSLRSVAVPASSDSPNVDSSPGHRLPGSLSSLRDFYNNKTTMNIKSESKPQVSGGSTPIVAMGSAQETFSIKTAPINLQNISGNKGQRKKVLNKMKSSVTGSPVDLSKTNGLSQSPATTNVTGQIPNCSQEISSPSSLGSLDSLRSFYLGQVAQAVAAAAGQSNGQTVVNRNQVNTVINLGQVAQVAAAGQSNGQTVVNRNQGNTAINLVNDKGNKNETKQNDSLSNGNLGPRTFEPISPAVQNPDEPKLLRADSQQAGGATVLDISIQQSPVPTASSVPDVIPYDTPIPNQYSPPIIYGTKRILPKIEKKVEDDVKTGQRKRKKVDENKGQRATSPKKKKVPTATLR